MAGKMEYKGDLLCIDGKYKDAQGVEKNRYVKCGALFEADGRMGINIKFIPIGVDPTKGLWLSYFPKDKQEKKPDNKQQSNGNGNSQASIDEVPF